MKTSQINVGASFKLPRVQWSEYGIKLLSFRQDALGALGVYLPSEGAVVINPMHTGTKSAEAIARHERTHQELSINTTFGLLTQLLILMAEQGLARDVLRECLAAQWCVQELAAIYAEISFVAATSPDLLSEQIRSLPSGRLDQPPYREVFDAINRFFPVGSGKSAALLSAQNVTVTMLASGALNSQCLVQMAAGPGTEASLMHCLSDSPVSWLERIMNSLIATGSLEALLAETVTLIAEDPSLLGPAIYARLVSLVPEVSMEADTDLIPQACAAATVYEAITGCRLDVPASRPASEPMVKMMESPELEEQMLAANPPRPIPAASLHKFLIETQRRKLGLTLELAVLDTEEAHLDARPYYLKPNHSPQPAEPEECPAEPLLDDLSGLMNARSAMHQLSGFPSLPHVAVFIESGWQVWYNIPGAREHLRSCVKICRQLHLSRDFVLQNILAFEGIGERAEVLVAKIGDDRYVGYFFNRQQPLAYGMQKVPGEYALKLFTDICNELNLAVCTEPKQIPHFDLLRAVSFWFPY